GGEHPRMATHNRLLRLGDTLYLEVIAPNPAAPAPGRPRWFGLDGLGPQSPPSLATWVVRCTDIRASAAAASEPPCPIASRGAGGGVLGAHGPHRVHGPRRARLAHHHPRRRLRTASGGRARPHRMAGRGASGLTHGRRGMRPGAARDLSSGSGTGFPPAVSAG